MNLLYKFCGAQPKGKGESKFGGLSTAPLRGSAQDDKQKI